MKLDVKKETLWIHQLWLLEEADKQKPDLERIAALKKVLAALATTEPTEEQRQMLQRMLV